MAFLLPAPVATTMYLGELSSMLIRWDTCLPECKHLPCLILILGRNPDIAVDF